MTDTIACGTDLSKDKAELEELLAYHEAMLQIVRARLTEVNGHLDAMIERTKAGQLESDTKT